MRADSDPTFVDDDNRVNAEFLEEKGLAVLDGLISVTEFGRITNLRRVFDGVTRPERVNHPDFPEYDGMDIEDAIYLIPGEFGWEDGEDQLKEFEAIASNMLSNGVAAQLVFDTLRSAFKATWEFAKK